MQTMVSHSPQKPHDIVCDVSVDDGASVEECFGKGRAAFLVWGRMAPTDRAAMLNTAADAMADQHDTFTELIVREVGKPWDETYGEVSRTTAIFRYYAQQVLDPEGQTYPAPGHGLLYTRCRPRGLAGLITPWNFPLAIPVWKAAPALAYGNTVILKPAEAATAASLQLAELLRPLLPDHTFQVVVGGPEVGRGVIHGVDVVSFTGSTTVGKTVRAEAASRGIPVQCEMGGQNPAIVLPDADMSQAADTIASAAMGYAGQKCTATSRVILTRDCEPFLEYFLDSVKRMSLGDPCQPDTRIGPVISQAAQRAVIDAADRATTDGGRLLTGGRAPDQPGWFVEPTVIDRVSADSPLATEELFGPLCTILNADDESDAVRIANNVDYGLTASVFTRNVDHILRMADDLNTGMVKINAATSGVDFYAPFGGEKNSSYGPREQRKAARNLYTTTQTVSIATQT